MALRTKRINLLKMEIKHATVPTWGGSPEPYWIVEVQVKSDSTGFDHVISHSDKSDPTNPARNLVIVNDLISTALKEAEDLSV